MGKGTLTIYFGGLIQRAIISRIFPSFEILFSDSGFPPFILRPELTLMLFCVIVILETGILLMVSPSELRFRLLWSVPLTNIISSFLFAPDLTGIYELTLGSSGYNFPPPLLAPAQTVWVGDNLEEILFALALDFLYLVVIYGLVSIWIEGGLLHLAIQPSERMLWKRVSLANAVSYLFLFSWSTWVGIVGRDRYPGDFNDHLDEYVGIQLSSKGVLYTQVIVWIVFALGLGAALLLIIRGNIMGRSASDSAESQQEILQKRTRRMVSTLVVVFLWNLGAYVPFLAIIRLILILPLYIVIVLLLNGGIPLLLLGGLGTLSYILIMYAKKRSAEDVAEVSPISSRKESRGEGTGIVAGEEYDD